MIKLKSATDIAKLRVGGARLAAMLEAVAAKVAPGVTTLEIDAYARELIAKTGDQASFLNYQPAGAARPYPAALCVSINDEVVHGIPGPRRIAAGDIVSLDGGLIHDGLFTDMALTVVVGENTAATKLLATAEAALAAGIAVARPGNHVGDISRAIQDVIKKSGYGIVKELSGHGVGYAVHEEPFVPNYGQPGRGALLKPGLVIAIEPMITIGNPDTITLADGYTVATVDGSLAAHVEKTIVITDGEPEILTK